MNCSLTREERCLAVRARARKKSVAAFVTVMQGYFPRYFNNVTFTAHSVTGQGGTVSSACVEGVLPNQSTLPPHVVREVTHYVLWLFYNPDATVVFSGILRKLKDNSLRHQQALSLIREVRRDTLRGVSAVIRLVWLSKGMDINTIPNLNKLGEEIRLLIMLPASDTWKLLQRHVVYGLDRKVVCPTGSLIESGSYDIHTESAIWLVSFTSTGATSDHRLRLMTLYVMMGQPTHIRQLAVINPHSGIYHTIDVASIPEAYLKLIKDCLYGTKEMLQHALMRLPLERHPVRQSVDFSLWQFMIGRDGFTPYPYISYMLAVMGGAVSSGKSVEDLIERLAVERVSVHETGHPSTQPGGSVEINTAMTMFIVNEFTPVEIVFVLATVETLLRWFNRVRYFTRLSSMSVVAPMFNNPNDDTFYVQTNNQVSIIKLNYEPLTSEGADKLIRQQVKMNNLPGKPPREGMLRNAPLISIVNPLRGEALCYETRSLPDNVYDLITSLTFWKE